MLSRFIRIPEWMSSYSRDDARGDVIAGVTVGVMLIPQCMAYAVLLGLPPVYGLYASIVPLLTYPLIGTSHHVAIGVVTIDMLVAVAGLTLIAEPGTDRFIELAVLLAMTVGILQVCMGLLRLGFIVHLLSRPVTAGFMSAAAILIGLSQLDALLGVELPQSQYIFVLLSELIGNLGRIHALSAAIGIGGIILLVFVRIWRPVLPGPLVLVVLATVLVWSLGLAERGVEVVGMIPVGLPVFELPELDWRSLRALIPTAITLALIEFMTVVSLGKVFAARHRYRISPNRELVALGMANAAGSLFQSIPVSGSFSRSAVNEQAGGRTAGSNVVAACVIVAAVLFLTPLLAHFPLPALASIVILAGVALVDLKEIRLLIDMKRIDGAIALFTFVATLGAGVLEGILLGIGASVVAVMYRISHPNVAVLGHIPGTQAFADVKRRPEARQLDGILLVRVDASLSFANAEIFRDTILQRTGARTQTPRVVIVDASSINDVDTTAVATLLELSETLRSHRVDLYFGGSKGAVIDVLTRAGLVEELGRDHFLVSAHEAVRQVLTEWGEYAEYLESTEEQDDLAARSGRRQP